MQTQNSPILPPAIFLMGPTASGKTDLALQLVQQRACEIISVDSALIYRGMDIGSAKPDADTLKIVPHHLINICDPAQTYSVAEFCQAALTLMADITVRHKIPLLVGGAMMYFKALVDGLAVLPTADTAIRAQLQTDVEKHGLAALYNRLVEVDPQFAQRLQPTDRQRLLRAMEVYLTTGESMSTHWQRQSRQSLPYQVMAVGLWPMARTVLHEHIEQRFQTMLQQGFVAEVEALRARGDLDLHIPSMRCVGYRQIWQYLNGDYDYGTMVHKSIVATRQLAKRQLTWLRKWPNLQIFDSTHRELAFTVWQLFDRIYTQK